MDTSQDNTPLESKLEKGRVLGGQYSLRLLASKVVFFGLCFGIIKNYIYPNVLFPFCGDIILYTSIWVCVLSGMMALYFGLLFGRNNIIENPLGWWRGERLSMTVLGLAIAVILAGGSLILQVFILDF